jgi:hypothetical protein
VERADVIPSRTSDRVVLLSRVLSRVGRRVRNCTYGDVLVLETGHRREGGATLESGLRRTVCTYFQVSTQIEGDFLTIRTHRVVTCWGYRLEGTGEECARALSFDLRVRGAVARAGEALTQIVQEPDRYLPTPGHRFPETGKSAWLEGMPWDRAAVRTRA